MTDQSQRRKIAIGSIIVLVAGALAMLTLWCLVGGDLGERPSLPTPNGYADFRTSASFVIPPRNVLRQQDFIPTDEMSKAQLQAVVSSNHLALHWIGVAVEKEWRMPYPYDQNYAAVRANDLPLARTLERVMDANARLHAMEGKTGEALDIALDIITFGQRLGKGGPTVDGLVGTAVTMRGLLRVTKLSEELSAKECREAIRRLQASAKHDLKLEEIMLEERRYVRAVEGVFGDVAMGWKKRSLRPYHSLREIMLGRINELIAYRNKALIRLATRAYELEHGRKPQSVKVLVPDYLPEVPVDPVGGKSLNMFDLLDEL